MSNVSLAREFTLKLNTTARDYPRVLGSMLNELTDVGYDTVREFTPVRTGKLRDGWQKHTRPDEDLGPREITNAVEYGPFVEFGTRNMAPRLMAFRTTQYLGTIVDEYYRRALLRFGFRS